MQEEQQNELNLTTKLLPSCLRIYLTNNVVWPMSGVHYKPLHLGLLPFNRISGLLRFVFLYFYFKQANRD